MLTGSHICRVDWHNNGWPWVTLNGRFRIALSLRQLSFLFPFCTLSNRKKQTCSVLYVVLQLVLVSFDFRQKFCWSVIVCAYISSTGNVTIASPRSEAQAHVCLPVRGATWWVLLQHSIMLRLISIVEYGIARFLCAVHVFQVRASSWSPRLPLWRISFLSRPSLLS